jgi:hypothetical protein
VNFAIPLEPAKGRPAFIARARERHEERLEHKPLKLLELHGAELLPEWQRRRLVPRRPKFREAAGKVIGAMLEHMDMVTARVGVPRGDGYVTPPGQQGPEGHEDDFGIAKDSGCSIQQVRRVIAAYVRAGYILGPRRGPDSVDATGKRQYGKMLAGPSGRRYQRVQEYTDPVTKEKRYHAHRVVYVFTDLFFERLALAKDWADDSKAASARRAERRQRMYPGPLLAGRERVRSIRHGSRESRPQGAPGAPTRAVGAPPAPTAPTPTPDELANAARLVQALMHGLRNKHPEWGLERLRAEAEALARTGRLR